MRCVNARAQSGTCRCPKGAGWVTGVSGREPVSGNTSQRFDLVLREAVSWSRFISAKCGYDRCASSFCVAVNSWGGAPSEYAFPERTALYKVSRIAWM